MLKSLCSILSYSLALGIKLTVKITYLVSIKNMLILDFILNNIFILMRIITVAEFSSLHQYASEKEKLLQSLQITRIRSNLCNSWIVIEHGMHFASFYLIVQKAVCTSQLSYILSFLIYFELGFIYSLFLQRISTANQK